MSSRLDTPPEAMTGTPHARANSPVAARFTPVCIPSRSMSVKMNPAAPAAARRRPRSTAGVSLTSAHPRTATRPSRASIPTRIRPGWLRREALHQGGVLQGRGAEDREVDPLPQEALRRGRVADAASQFQGHSHGPADRPHGLEVFRPPGEGSVQVHHVDAAGPLGLPPGRHGARVVGVDRVVLHAALPQAHAPPPLEVDRRDDDHAPPSPRTRSQNPRSSASPTRWLFSGWNWLA